MLYRADLRRSRPHHQHTERGRDSRPAARRHQLVDALGLPVGARPQLHGRQQRRPVLRKLDSTGRSRGPSAATDIAADWASSADHVAEVVWSTNDDPDIDTGLVYGSSLNEDATEVRYKRSGGNYSTWASASDGVLRIGSANEGDQIVVDVRLYDFAGRSTIASQTITVPNGNPTAHAAVAFVAPLVCAAGGCEAIGAGLTYIGAGALGWATYDNYKKDLKRDANSAIKVDRQSTNDSDTASDNPETRGEFEARVKSQRWKLRAEAEGNRDIEPYEEAHHIVAVGAKRAAYARDVMWKCGLDPNDWFTNGTPLHRKYHGRIHTNAYYDSVNRILKRYDPSPGKGDPTKGCNEFSGRNGLKQALRDIARDLKAGRFPF